MGLEDTVKKAIHNIGDAIHEVGHRSAAEGERAKREVAGDDMTLGEKAKSIANEGGNQVAAEVDRLKRDVRDNT